MYKKTFLLDLDGVLNEYNGKFNENEIPPIKEGTKNFLKSLADKYELKIFTTRNRLLTAKWLIKHNLDTYIKDITNVKEPAYLHIDDRCICFNGDFEETEKQIVHFKTYWK